MKDTIDDGSERSYREREESHYVTELVVGAAAARYAATIQTGAARVLAEAVACELIRRAAAALKVPT